MPAPQEANNVRINLGAEQGHGTARAQRAGLDIFGKEAQRGANGLGRGTQEVGNISRGNRVCPCMHTRIGNGEVGAQRRGQSSGMETEMDDATGKGTGRATE